MLYLHVGLHKTGTTSFQYACIQNRHLLFEVGIDYPEDKLLTLGAAQHLAFSRSFANIRDTVPLVKFHKDCDVFVSSEEIINSLTNFSDEEIFDVFNWLSLYFGGLVIVLSVREQHALAESLVREYSEGSGFYGLREFLPRYRERIARLLRFATAFPLVIVDIDQKPLDMALASYYIYVATGKKVALPEIVTNTSRNKEVMQYFLGTFRGFYSTLLSVDPYDEKINEIYFNEVIKNISLQPEFKARLQKEIDELFRDVVLKFFENDGYLIPTGITGRITN